MNTIFFTSGRNYMKRSPVSGSTSIAAPVTSAYSGALYITNYTVTHNLGFIPVFRAYYERFKDGVIWPPMGSRINGTTVNPRNTSQTGPGLICWPTTTTLTIQLFYINNTLTGTYPIYWTIYEDYQV